jgi:hypothetical protein
MPRGFDGVRSASAEVEARRSGGGPGALWFRLKAGDEAIVRFLEQDDDIFWCYMHEVPVEGRNFGRDEVCLNQESDSTPCPGCEQDLPRRFKGFVNVIWFEAPVFKRDSENKLVKDRLGDPVVIANKPQVAVWGSGIRVFEELDETNTNYRGLTSRRFRVKRKGEKLDTKYHIAPADVDGGPQAMDAQEAELAKGKYDLNEFVKPKTYDEFLKAMGQVPSNGSVSSTPTEQATKVNPFMRKTA